MENKNSNSKVGTLIKMIILIILSPFALPIILKLMVLIKLFSSPEQYREYSMIFSNKYTLFSVIMVLILLFLVFVDKFDTIKEIFMGFDFNFKFGNKEFNIKSKDQKKPVQEVFDKSIEDSKDSKEINNQIIQVLNKSKNSNPKNIKDDEIKELKSTLNNIRFFSAYNNTNYMCSDLLNYLYTRNTISKHEFEEKLEEYYTSRVKDIKGKKKKECVKRKVSEKIFNYNYLDIIEVSDDNEDIILTDLGREFVKKYLKREDD